VPVDPLLCEARLNDDAKQSPADLFEQCNCINYHRAKTSHRKGADGRIALPRWLNDISDCFDQKQNSVSARKIARVGDDASFLL